MKNFIALCSILIAIFIMQIPIIIIVKRTKRDIPRTVR